MTGVNDGQGVEDIVGYLEKDLRYLLADPDTLAESRSTKQIQDKLMKVIFLEDAARNVVFNLSPCRHWDWRTILNFKNSWTK